MCKIKLKKHQTSAEMLIDSKGSVSRSIFNKKEKLDNYILMKVENLLCATCSTGMQLRWTKDCWGNQNIFYSELLTVWGQTELYLEQCITAQLVECVRMTVEPLMGAWIFKIWPCRLTQCFIRCHDENSAYVCGTWFCVSEHSEMLSFITQYYC